MIFKEENFHLQNEVLILALIETAEGDQQILPYYYYDIILKSSMMKVGKISIRIGHNYHSYYNGNIGFEIYEDYQGHNYSLIASRLVINAVLSHEMKYLNVTCNKSNVASNKTIMKLGGKLMETVVPPNDYVFFFPGMEEQNIYLLEIS